MKKNQQGFSLIELLIVVVIIGIIAAIAIPNLLASRRAANEASAMSVLRTINSAEATCQSTAVAGANAYCTSAQLVTANLLDSTFSAASSQRSGYTFAINLPAGTAIFDATAIPDSLGTTGTRSFATNESGVIYANTTAAAPTFATTAGRAVTNGTPIQ